ncbi:MAG: TonB-dependent receptor [Saprospiraceae bacterium]
MHRLLFIGLLLLSYPGIQDLRGQDILSQKIDFACISCTPQEALVTLSKQTGVNIVFNSKLFQQCPRVDVDAREQSLSEVLNSISACAKLNYRIVNNQVVFYRKARRFTLNGFIVDEQTGERLIGASILANGKKPAGAISNEFGFFSLTLDEGLYGIQVQYIGYKTHRQTLELSSNEKLNVQLTPFGSLPEVLISASTEERDRQGYYREDRQALALGRLNTLAMPGGEADVLRLAALQTGVQSGVDGLGGLHIRGGNADQNLILLDDVPVYNPNHALGLFSIFNPETVSQVQLWKGDFPARYGGRAASVIDVRTREGNFKEFHTSLNTGMFSSSLTLEGPVVRDKSSFILGTRFTYLKPWVDIFSRRENLLTFSGDRVVYRFYDANLKWNYNFSEKHRLYFTYYQGGDAFRDQFDQVYISAQGIATDQYTVGSSWGNNIAALRWNYILGSRLFTNTTLRFSRFVYQSQLSFNSQYLYPNGKESTLADYGQLYQTLIQDWSGKTDFTFFPNEKLTLRWGLSFTSHNFQPGALSVNFLIPGQSAGAIDSLAAVLLNNETLRADALETYVDTEWRFGNGWELDLGVNASIFQIRETSYRNILPRARFQHSGRRGWDAWVSYSQMAQNLHQIGSFNISLPFELWVPSTAKVPPEQVWQTALGIGFERGRWNWQVEAYYKNLNRVLAFLSANDALYTGGTEDASGWEDRIAIGSGFSKGIEALLAFNHPNSSFSIGYTLSQSVREFPDINSGNAFPFRFDRKHDVKVNFRQRIASWLDGDFTWVFATGNPITLSGVKYTHHSPNSETERDVYVYTAVNAYRLPAFHRLDISLKAHWGRDRFQHGMQFGAYNVYNRANPFFLFLDATSGVAGKAIQYTLLPVLPIFRYELRF